MALLGAARATVIPHLVSNRGRGIEVSDWSSLEKREEARSSPGVEPSEASGCVDLLGRTGKGETVVEVGSQLCSGLHGRLDGVCRKEDNWGRMGARLETRVRQVLL